MGTGKEFGLDPEVLMGDALGTDGPVLEHQEDGFCLRVMVGATSAFVTGLRRQTAKGVRSDWDRAHYQSLVELLMVKVLSQRSESDVRIITGFLVGSEILPEAGRARIDALAATEEGVMALRESAKKNGIELELNLALMVFGSPEEVLGDIQDATKRLPDNLGYFWWNEWRQSDGDFFQALAGFYAESA